MPTYTGIDAQIGLAKESTYGTAVTVTRFLPLVSETLKRDIDRLESAGIRATRQVITSAEWAAGQQKIGGNVALELTDQSLGLVLEQCFGTVNWSGTLGTFWPAPPNVSSTWQVGRPLSYGTVQPFTYTGCKVDSWELKAEVGKIVTFGCSLVAQTETMGTALASVSYASNLKPITYTSCTLTLGTVAVPVKSFSLKGENSLDDNRRFMNTGGTISEPLRMKEAVYSGQLDLEWGNPSSQGTLIYDRFFSATESALVFTYAAGTNSGTITANVRYDGNTPNIKDAGIVDHMVPFKCIASGATDDTAIKVRYQTNDATP